jgi:acyl carrier protein
MTITIDEVRNAIAAAFEIPLDVVKADSSNEDIEKWDSIGHMNLVMALEEHFGVGFTMEEILQMKSVGAIWKLLEGKTNPVKAL